MEPPINYSGAPEGPYINQKPQKKSGGFKGCMLIGTIILLLLIAGAALLIYKLTGEVKKIVDIPNNVFGPPTENPENVDKRFAGSFIDAVLIPQSDGSTKLFVLTDGSVKYMLKQKSTGRFSMGWACNDCKTISYIYDPAVDKVVTQTENKFSDIISQSHIIYANGKIMQFTNPTEKDGPRINTYDPASGEIIADTKAFLDQHQELSSGIIDLTFHDRDQTVSFLTKDGQRDLVYDPASDKIYKDEIKMRNELGESAGGGRGTIYFLRTETGDKRESLFKVTASKKDIITRESTLESYLTNQSFLKDIIPTAVVEKPTDKTFLNGKIYYQDDDYFVIIYLDQAGKIANRLLVCYDAKTGKEAWSLEPDALFPEMKINEKDDSGSSYTMTYDKIKFRRANNILMMTFQETGMKGFDLKSGKQIWQLEIHAK